MQAGPVQIPGAFPREQRTACQLCPGSDDQGGIAVAHVPSGALTVVARRRLLQGVAVWDYPVFRAAPSWAPATVLDGMRDGPVKSCAVNSRLATRHDFMYQHMCSGI